MKFFQSLVGRLLWIARCTILYMCIVSYSANKATRQIHERTTDDCKMVKNITRYLKETKRLWLQVGVVRRSIDDIKVEIWGYTDFAAGKSDRKSVSGVCVL